MLILAKISRFFRNLFSVRVIIAGVETDDYDCHLRCINEKCAMWNKKTMSCNCKGVFIGADGKCNTAMKYDGKHGEFPIF